MKVYSKDGKLYHHGVKGMKWEKKMSNKEIKEAAQDVINGKYSNGSERKKELGDNYEEIQSKVNDILGVDKTSKDDKKKSSTNELDKIARDVIRGKYSNGAERKKKFGKEYDKIQKRVNRMLSSKKIKDIDDKKTNKGKKFISKIISV